MCKRKKRCLAVRDTETALVLLSLSDFITPGVNFFFFFPFRVCTFVVK